MWCIDCCCKRHQELDVVEDNASNDAFQDDDFNDFFFNDVNHSRDENGDYSFKLVEHKLSDVTAVDLDMSISNTGCQLLGGGKDTPTVTESVELGTQEDVRKISLRVKQYKSLDSFDMKVPGLRHKQIEDLTRLKELYLRKLSFYFDEDTFLMSNWEVAAMRNNSVIVDKINTLKSRDKVTIATLTIHTEWLKAALEYVKEVGISIGTETCLSDSSSHGLDLTGVYELHELVGSGPRLVKNIALSVFSNDPYERAENKLELVLQRNAHLHFSADKICQTMLRICQAANLSSNEFHCFMMCLRDPRLPTCPCGNKGSTRETWAIHKCKYEAWVMRIGIAEEVGSYLRFIPFDWSTIIRLATNTLSDVL